MIRVLTILTCVLTLSVFSGCVQNVSDNIKTEREVKSWEVFLSDYEEWTEKYIEKYKKYKNNPSDIDALREYTAILNEMTEWSKKAVKVKKELINASDLEMEIYRKRVLEISKRISNIKL